ncbi:LacI family DNA-binding transcriptional regulator [Auraticoccus sp. F435]|uniref:LacI family DNA-binding transcriptional regulator n=1 Tax=Auraticoccus cholistanensis TaxID=2656650 RepID=A0A6A9UVF4_9ACTN|nr:LacI family DNA-binding transcriptional regulator [Auraticoccus cholistanensis]MVA76668.1 LacI family DNA-binding transcriptional regulator [Auraticoccus cholistanensis]
MHDVARLAGVSTMTVSNVVNARAGVSDPVRRRVLAAIADSGYQVNVSARNLRSGRTGVLGLAVPEVDRPYFGQLAARMISRAARLGYRMVVEQTAGRLDGELAAIESSRHQMYDGLVLCAVGIGPDDVRSSPPATPVVVMGERPFEGTVDHVAMPNREGARTAVLHLAGRGSRAIALVGGGARNRDDAFTLREAGYRDALAELGLVAHPELAVRLPTATSAGGREAVAELVRRGTPFDAVFAVTDTVALGVLRGLADAGLAVPGAVRVVGYDDLDEARYSVPSLTSVAPDHDWMAGTALDLLLARLSGARDAPPVADHIAPFRLAVRESSGRAADQHRSPAGPTMPSAGPP